MAIPNFKAFPTGYRLIDGFKLNKLFQGQEGITPAIQGGSINGSASSPVTIGGVLVNLLAVVIATGASHGTARAVGTTANTIVVNASASTEGVKLPSPVTGQEMTVMAPTANGCLVYANVTGQSIGTGTTCTTGLAVTKNTAAQLIAISKTKWRVVTI